MNYEELKKEFDKKFPAQECSDCDNSGVVYVPQMEYAIVTRDMALDAGDETLEGARVPWGHRDMPVPCQFCYTVADSDFNRKLQWDWFTQKLNSAVEEAEKAGRIEENYLHGQQSEKYWVEISDKPKNNYKPLFDIFYRRIKQLKGE